MKVTQSATQLLVAPLNSPVVLYHCSDDLTADSTYAPNENYPPAPVTRVFRGHQTCEYVSCSSEVFAACCKCSSFLRWEYFDDFEFLIVIE